MGLLIHVTTHMTKHRAVTLGGGVTKKKKYEKKEKNAHTI